MRQQWGISLRHHWDLNSYEKWCLFVVTTGVIFGWCVRWQLVPLAWGEERWFSQCSAVTFWNEMIFRAVSRAFGTSASAVGENQAALTVNRAEGSEDIKCPSGVWCLTGSQTSQRSMLLITHARVYSALAGSWRFPFTLNRIQNEKGLKARHETDWFYFSCALFTDALVCLLYTRTFRQRKHTFALYPVNNSKLEIFAWKCSKWAKNYST